MKAVVGSSVAILEDLKSIENRILNVLGKLMRDRADFLPHSLIDFNMGLQTLYRNDHVINKKILYVLSYYFGETMRRNIEGIEWVHEPIITEAEDLYLQLTLPFQNTIISVDINPAQFILSSLKARKPQYLYAQYCLYETLRETVVEDEVSLTDGISLIIRNEFGEFRFDFKGMEL